MATPVIKHIAESVRSLAPYQPGRPIAAVARERGVSDIIKLASNENPLGPSPAALAALRAADAYAWSRYPDSNSGDLRKILSQKLQVEPQQLLFGNGSNDIIELAAQLLLREGTAAVVSQYAFVVYEIVCKARMAALKIIPARDYGHDLTAMAAAAKDNAARLVFVANPNNPTGSWHPPQKIHDFLRQVPPDVLVLLDEAYHEYLPRMSGDTLSFLSEFPNLMITRTFSKIHGLAGLRAGYAVVHPEIADMINRIRQPFNFSAAAQIAAAAALQDDSHLKASRALNAAGLRQLREGLQAMNLQTMPSAANFITFAAPSSAVAAASALLDCGVIVRDLTLYQLPRWLRVSVGLEEENRRFLRALAQVLGR